MRLADPLARSLRTALLMAALGILVAACGMDASEDASAPAEAESPAAQEPSGEAAAAEPESEPEPESESEQGSAMEKAGDEPESSEDAEGVVDEADDQGAGDEAGEAAVTKLNLNEASPEDFATVPGVGDRMVREFLEYRPYVSIAQFRREIGKYVDEDVVTGFESFVYVPVDPNASDEATLMQLPGVDAAIAATLAEGRPYADEQAFVDALAAQVGDARAEQGRSYVYLP